MSKIRKPRKNKSKLETRIVEDSRVLSSYGYCELPAHFFDRALQSQSPKATGLSVDRWKMNVTSAGDR